MVEMDPMGPTYGLVEAGAVAGYWPEQMVRARGGRGVASSSTPPYRAAVGEGGRT